MDNLRSQVRGAFPSMPSFRALAAGSAAVAGTIGTIGTVALKASADMEVLKKGLEFSLGKAGAEQLITSIQQIGEKSAYNTNELIPMARAFVNIGDNAQTAAEKMQIIVDAGSAYDMTSEAIGRVTTALSQMQMKGKISAEEMLQLTEAGVPAWDLLASKMGIAAQIPLSGKGELNLYAVSKDGVKSTAAVFVYDVKEEGT